MFSTPSTLLLCTFRSLSASPSGTNTQSWSADPLSPHCSARPPSAVDMPETPSTRPLATLTRRYGPDEPVAPPPWPPVRQ